jgi:hypothetical protein
MCAQLLVYRPRPYPAELTINSTVFVETKCIIIFPTITKPELTLYKTICKKTIVMEHIK